MLEYVMILRLILNSLLGQPPGEERRRYNKGFWQFNEMWVCRLCNTSLTNSGSKAAIVIEAFKSIPSAEYVAVMTVCPALLACSLMTVQEPSGRGVSTDPST